MKVLITGGMGVIGAETSRRFVKEGHRPILFARHRDDNLIGDIAEKVDVELGDQDRDHRALVVHGDAARLAELPLALAVGAEPAEDDAVRADLAFQSFSPHDLPTRSAQDPYHRGGRHR